MFTDYNNNKHSINYSFIVMKIISVHFYYRQSTRLSIIILYNNRGHISLYICRYIDQEKFLMVIR